MAIGWTIIDIKLIMPSICMHYMLLEEGAMPSRQSKRRLNPPMMDVVKKEILKLLEVGVIYLILDSSWVSPVQVVPKKTRITIVKIQNDELVPTRVQNRWQVIFRFQLLRTTFAYLRMPFGLCNASATFQRCMVSIFSDYIEHIIEVFMNDFTVYEDSFDTCLHNLKLVLQRCIETNLVLNSEKCHFMVEQGIVLGHVVSSRGIEVDKSKIDIIQSLPYPTHVRNVHSFIGHAGFHRKFIKDFSKIALPLCKLLQKDVAFEFDEACKKVFDKLMELLTSVPVIQPLDWNVPFEIMCDASDMHSLLFDDEERGKTKTNKMDTSLEVQRDKVKSDAKYYVWDDPYIWKHCADQVIRFGIPRALISDRGTQFCNRTVETLLRKYHVVHKVSTAHHLQTSGQAKILNIKKDESGEHGNFQLQELEEIRNDAYESARIYKEKTKAFHDKMISRKDLQGKDEGFSRLCLFSGAQVDRLVGANPNEIMKMEEAGQLFDEMLGRKGEYSNSMLSSLGFLQIVENMLWRMNYIAVHENKINFWADPTKHLAIIVVLNHPWVCRGGDAHDENN
ncbi:uncharacterized protein [Aristolochia californica]|uniref:uncharacterized protein n=1 Tax=Aristolochia californica TaxID=171875 RepID=UPI0035D956EB